MICDGWIRLKADDKTIDAMLKIRQAARRCIDRHVAGAGLGSKNAEIDLEAVYRMFASIQRGDADAPIPQAERITGNDRMYDRSGYDRGGLGDKMGSGKFGGDRYGGRDQYSENRYGGRGGQGGGFQDKRRIDRGFSDGRLERRSV